jgi:hypothetical protein
MFATLMMTLLVAGTLGFVAWKQHQDKGSINGHELMTDARELVRQLMDAGQEIAALILQEAPGAIRSCVAHARDNMTWLYHSWRKGLGAKGVYERPLGNDSDDDDEDGPGRPLEEITQDDYARRRPSAGTFLPSVREEDEDEESKDGLATSGSSVASEGILVNLPTEQDDESITRL